MGGIATLLVIQPSRAVLLHVLHTKAVISKLNQSVLSASGAPLAEPGFAGKMTLPEVSQQMLLIANRIHRDKRATISARDFEIAREYLSRGEELEPDNAYWPQLRAAIANRAGRGEQTITNLERAAEKRYWNSGSTQEMLDLWSSMSASEGVRLSWQGLFVRELRADAPAHLILELQTLEPPTNAQDADAWRTRYLITWNFSILRDGARSVEVTASAARAVLRLADSFVDANQDRTPLAIDQARSLFVTQVFNVVGQKEGERTSIAVRNAIAQDVSIEPRPIILENRDRAGLLSLLFGSLPSVLFLTGVLMCGVAVIGLITSRLFGDIPHIDARLMVGTALVLAAGAGIASGAWLFGGWILLVVSLLGVPIEAPLPHPVEWSRMNRLAIGILTGTCMVLIAFWLFASGPTSLLAERLLPFATPLVADPTASGILALVAITFLIPISVLWAHVKRRTVLRVLGEAFARVGLTGAIVSLSAAVIATPIAIYYDAKLSSVVQRWVMNETDAFRIAPR